MDEVDEGREGYRAYCVDSLPPHFVRVFEGLLSVCQTVFEAHIGKEVDSDACAFESEHFVHDE